MAFGLRTRFQGLIVAALATAMFAQGDRAARAAILSAKRGYADTGASYNYLQATGAGWYYTWGTGVANPGNYDAVHYPMFWNAPSQTTINNVKARNPAYVLGFNEPERTDQANMTVAQAISSWTAISNAFTGTSTKLVSPAVSDTSGGQQWLASFMSQANSNGLKVDAVAFHWYGVSTPDNPAGAASSFLSRVASYNSQYGKPVFITEFAIHDWAGAYSDAQITEANRQFLDIVIPELENRSYVLGYAFYPWFSDGPLFSGNPPKPTPMGHTYVGALKPGTVENIGGQNLGQHVAYLAGGELTVTGTAPTIRYIDSLTGTSTISGSLNWGLTAGNWVRVTAGSTLRKAGANQISFTGGSITNLGTIEVQQGTLLIGSAVAGGGKAVVKGGVLQLTGGGSFPAHPQVEVRSGGTLNVAALTGGSYVVPNGQLLTLQRNGTIAGGVVAANGGAFAGAGAVNGNLVATSGGTIRVGDDGAGAPSRILIDNFETYALGDLRTVASPPWTAHQDTTFADVESLSGNKVMSFGWTGDFRGASRTLPDAAVLDNAATATLFFRVNSKTDVPNHNLGLGDVATTTAVNFGDFEAQVRLKQGTSAGTFAIDARDAGGFSATLAGNLALNSWYNLWMVINQASDTYDVYMNTGGVDATAANKLNAAPLKFRNGTTSDLNTFLALAGAAPVDNGVRVDSITYLSGFDLTNPANGFDPNFVWTPETLAVGGDYTQNDGARLQINLLDPDRHDVLNIAGAAHLGGTLAVSLAVGAPAPKLGDVFDILKFGSADGAFTAFSLPSLDPGLVWDTTQLATTGELIVSVVPGDFDRDLDIDGDDLLAWQRGDSPNPFSAVDLANWQANYGSPNLASPTAAAVPEPAAAALALLALAGGQIRRRRA
jgi:hypothetical protein